MSDKPKCWTRLHSAARDNNLKTVTSLLAENANVNALDSESWTPLHSAANNGHIEVINTLINEKADVNAIIDRKWSPLHFAASNGYVEVTMALINANAEINTTDDNGMESPLHLAENEQIAEILIQAKAKVNCRDAWGWTPLHRASCIGKINIIDVLIRNAADVHATTNNKMTPLHFSVNHGHTQATCTLLDAQANINATDIEGNTPLHYAPNGILADILARNGADINSTNVNKWTPLHFAADTNQGDSIASLLNANADVKAVNDEGKKPLDILEEKCKLLSWYSSQNKDDSPLHQAACHGEHVSLINLVGLGANLAALNKDGNTPLHQTVQHGNMDTVDLLIRLGADIAAINTKGDTAIHLAASNSTMNMVEGLLRLGAVLSARNKEGDTPLHRAAANGNKAMVEGLIAVGANKLASNNMGDTIIHKAVASGNIATVTFLVGLRCDIVARNIEGDTPLHQAARRGDVVMVEGLIRLGASISKSNKKGKKPLDLLEDHCKESLWYTTDNKENLSLHQAVSQGKHSIVKCLISLGAKVSARSNQGNTPLHYARHSDLAKVLLENKADVNRANADGNSPLHFARDGDLAAVLIVNKAKVNSDNAEGNTPLHFATNRILAEILVRNGANINRKNVNGDTPLHRVAGIGEIDTMNLLISQGVNTSVRNKEGKTPLDFLEEKCKLSKWYRKDAKSDTPLHQAAASGELTMVEGLISLNADTSVRNDKGCTPLHQAAANGYTDTIEGLIRLGSDISAINIQKKKPLALFEDHCRKSDWYKNVEKGQSPLHLAVIAGQQDPVKAMIKLGANLENRNEQGKTPLDLAKVLYRQNTKKTDRKIYRRIYEILKQKNNMLASFESSSKSVESKTKKAEVKNEKNVQLPWLVDADEFQRMLSQGEFLSYENRLSLAGPCKAGKSTLASVLIGENIPMKWESTDGLVIFFGRNGIDIKEKKMVPLKEGKREHGVLAKIILGKPVVQKTSTQVIKEKISGNIHQKNSTVKTEIETSKPLTKDTKKGDESTLSLKDQGAGMKRAPVSELLLEHNSTQIPGSNLPSAINEIQFEKLQLQSDILEEVRKNNYTIEIAPSDLIDFGGQKSYDMTHQLFIQHRGSLLLMFDGRFGLHQQLEEYPEGVDAASVLKHWVESVLTYTEDSDDIMPMIMFVATHKDQCKGVPGELQQTFINDIKQMFSGYEGKCHLHLDTVYFINGINRNDPEIQRMTDQVVKFAMMQSSWGQRRPMQWVPLELQLSNMRTKNINIVVKDELRLVNQLNGDLALNERQLDDFLLVQHSLGKLMYYKLPGLDEFVIIHPPALVNILRSFVTDEKFWPQDPSLKSILQEIRNTGKIYKKDLLKLWDQSQFQQYMQDDAIKEFVIQLLVHLDILIVPKASQKGSSEVYLVPCMIKTIRPDFRNLESQRENTICLEYSLIRSSIPSALAYKVIGAAVIAWPLKYESGKPCLYHKAAVLNLSEDDEIRIWLEDKRITVYMTNQNSLLSISPDIAASLQECLTKNLESSLLFYFNSSGKIIKPTKVPELYKMALGIPCGNGVCYKAVHEINQIENWKCNKGKTHDTRYLRYWIFDKTQQQICDPKCRGLNFDELQTEPSERHLVRLGKQIGIAAFKNFYINLGMQVDTWDDLEYHYGHHSPDGIKLMALVKWKDTKFSYLKAPTLQDLSDALTASNLNCHVICQIFRENMKGVDKAELHETPSDDVLKNLSSQIGNYALQLGIELGLSFGEVEESLFKFPKALSELIEDILRKWKEKSKVKTIHSLMMALTRVNGGGMKYLYNISK